MLDVNDLLEECRSKGYFDIEQLEYAIMETSGKISFYLKVNIGLLNQRILILNHLTMDC